MSMPILTVLYLCSCVSYMYIYVVVLMNAGAATGGSVDAAALMDVLAYPADWHSYQYEQSAALPWMLC